MLFESHPKVITKYQPLFSYEFKNRITPQSSPEEFNQFLENLQASTSDFINMRGPYHQDENNQFPTTPKQNPTTLLFKNTHNHQLAETFLKLKPNIKLIYLLRHPCGAINSFINNPRECDSSLINTDEWLTGACKNNDNPNNYFGYNKWLELTEMFYNLRDKYPTNVYIVIYEDILNNPTQLKALFDWCGLDYHPQVQQFFDESHQKDCSSHTAVYKSKSVQDKWKTSLGNDIKNYIMQDLEKHLYLNGNWGEF